MQPVLGPRAQQPGAEDVRRELPRWPADPGRRLRRRQERAVACVTGARVIGLDVSWLAIDRAIGHDPQRRVSWLVADAAALPLEQTARFDVVVAYGLLHCLPNQEVVHDAWRPTVVDEGGRPPPDGHVQLTCAGREAQVAAEWFLSRLRARVEQRFARLGSTGIGPDELERETDTVIEEMEDLLPLPSGAVGASGMVWTTEQLRAILGRRGPPISRQAVHDRVRRGTLLALRVAEHGQRVYPLWQFYRRPDGRVVVVPGLAVVLRAVAEAVADRCALASWLRRPETALDAKSPLEYLIEHGGADDRMLDVTRSAAARWTA